VWFRSSWVPHVDGGAAYEPGGEASTRGIYRPDQWPVIAAGFRAISITARREGRGGRSACGRWELGSRSLENRFVDTRVQSHSRDLDLHQRLLVQSARLIMRPQNSAHRAEIAIQTPSHESITGGTRLKHLHG